MIELTATEQMIMKCIWKLGGNASVADLLNSLREQYGKTYARTTISVFMSYLRDKGYVTYEKRSHAYVYNPVVSEEEYQREVLLRYQETTFGGSVTELVSVLLNSQPITAKDCSQLIRLINKKKKECGQ